MIVFVESNFILEIALGQEQSEAAGRILELAERDSFDLAFPAFSVGEPFATLTQRRRRADKLTHELSDYLKDVGRSRPHREDVEQVSPTPEVLARFAERESEMLWGAMHRLLSNGMSLATDLDVFEAARGYQASHALSAQDSIVHASIIKHLRLHQATSPHMFVNKNWREFRTVNVVNELTGLRCRLVDRFDEAVALLGRRAP